MEKNQIIGLSVSLGLVVLFASLYKFYSSETENVTINDGLYPDDLDKMLNKNIFGNNDNDNDVRRLSTDSTASTDSRRSSTSSLGPYIPPAGGSRRRKRSKKRKTKKRSTKQRR
jgi:hypothetical protein